MRESASINDRRTLKMMLMMIIWKIIEKNIVLQVSSNEITCCHRISFVDTSLVA